MKTAAIHLLEAYAKMLEETAGLGDTQRKVSFTVMARKFTQEPEKFEVMVRYATEVVVQHFNRQDAANVDARKLLDITKAVDVYVRFFAWLVVELEVGEEESEAKSLANLAIIC